MGAGHQKAQAPDERVRDRSSITDGQYNGTSVGSPEGKVWGASGSNVLMCQERTRPRKGTGTLCHPQPDTWP